MRLDTPVSELHGAGPKRVQSLRSLGIETVQDLLNHYPSRVEFAPEPARIAGNSGEVVTIVGRVTVVPLIGGYTRTLMCIVDTTLGEQVTLRWFNARYVETIIHRGTRIMATGVLTGKTLTNPEFRTLPTKGEPDLSNLRVVVYPVTSGITSKDIGRFVKQVLHLADETVRSLHDPRDQAEYESAVQSEKYNELFYMQLALAVRKQQRESEPTNVRCVPPRLDITQYFPFSFTVDQERAVDDISRDMFRGVMMNRLLQGDVGCVDADTEFLSPNGWVPISKWSGEKVAQFHPNIGAAEFIDPTYYIKEPCTEFIHLHTKYGIDQMLSPEHRCLIYRHSKVTREYDRGSVILAGAIEGNHNQNVEGFRGRFETSFAMHTGSRVDLTEDQLRLMVAVCADAHIASKTSCVLSFKKRHKIDRALHLLYVTDTEYTETRSAGYTRLRFRPPVLRKGLEQFWGASHGQLEVIAEEALLWDGNGKNAFYTRRKCEADFVQYAMSATGKRARLLTQNRKDGSIDFVVLISSKTKVGISSNPKTPINRVPSKDGLKYCFEVPSSFLILRRNGCVFITGNSGKTAVAAYAAMLMACNGGQTAILCPTQVLAEQHYNTVKGFFDAAGLDVALITGSSRNQATRCNQITKPRWDVVIGTTSILSDFPWTKLGLVVVDEEHRFGAVQRAVLNKHGNPHYLKMTATPIPRTIAMTAFGDLDVSTIHEMPPGRLPVDTMWVEPGTPYMDFMNQRIGTELAKGHQIYVVCPRIEALDDEMRAVEEVWREYQDRFPDASVSYIHGKMNYEDKLTVTKWWGQPAKGFSASGRVLVATTVVEVGVDNPNATVMVVEGAEHFGLATLHQLRGRVGRSDKQSYCFLLSDTESAEGRARLKAMEQTNDGFEIAEIDLSLRGPGSLLSTQQHGLPDLKLADLVSDYELMLEAREDARETVDAGLSDADRKELDQRFGKLLSLGDMG